MRADDEMARDREGNRQARRAGVALLVVALAAAVFASGASARPPIHKLNFQPAGADVPDGFIAETGEAFSSGQGYGWTTHNGDGRPRDMDHAAYVRNAGTNRRADTGIDMTPEGRAWGRFEIALPDGWYEFWITVGDTATTSVRQVLAVEDRIVLDWTQTPGERYRTFFVEQVRVTDGRLSLHAAGGADTALVALTIREGEAPPAPTTTTTVATTTSTTTSTTTTAPGTIDERVLGPDFTNPDPPPTDDPPPLPDVDLGPLGIPEFDPSSIHLPGLPPITTPTVPAVTTTTVTAPTVTTTTVTTPTVTTPGLSGITTTTVTVPTTVPTTGPSTEAPTTLPGAPTTGAPTTTQPPPTTTTRPPAGDNASVGAIAGIAPGSHFPYMDLADIEREMDLLAQTGTRWLRMPFTWQGMQPQPDRYKFSKHAAIADAARDRGIQIIANVAYAPQWARVDGCSIYACAPRDARDYADFMEALVHYFEPLGVRHYEIWNEPNMKLFWQPQPDPDAYAELVRTTYAQVKIHHAGAVFLAGSTSPAKDLANGNQIHPVTFLERLIDRGIIGSFDEYSHHPYVYPAAPETEAPWHGITTIVPQLTDTLRQAGETGADVWGTEFSYHTGTAEGQGGVSEETQADYVARSYRAWQEVSDAPLIWFNLRDRGTNPDDREHNFGIRYQDWRPKPAWSAWVDAMAERQR